MPIIERIWRGFRGANAFPARGVRADQIPYACRPAGLGAWDLESTLALLQALKGGDADTIALARTMLYDPRWSWHAAATVGAQVEDPQQYWRSQPHEFINLFKDMRVGQR